MRPGLCLCRMRQGPPSAACKSLFEERGAACARCSASSVTHAPGFCCAEYLQNSLHPFHFPGPQSHTCSQGLSDTKRARFYGDLGGFSHATLTSSPVASKLIEAVSVQQCPTQTCSQLIKTFRSLHVMLACEPVPDMLWQMDTPSGSTIASQTTLLKHSISDNT